MNNELHLAVKPNPKIEVPLAYEDSDLVIVNKPSGMVTQPGKAHATDSMLNGLFARYGKFLHNLGVKRDFGLLHRLDRDTSGLLVVALKPSAYDQLRRDFEDRKIEKEYLTITAGVPKPPQGVCQARLKEIVAGIKKVIISRQGQEAISAYQTLSTTKDAALIRVAIKTGRLHQIRAHMMFLGAQVAGEDIYLVPTAPKLPRPPRLALHAAMLGFKHPITGKWLETRTSLPPDLVAYAEKIGLQLK